LWSFGEITILDLLEKDNFMKGVEMQNTKIPAVMYEMMKIMILCGHPSFFLTRLM